MYRQVEIFTPSFFRIAETKLIKISNGIFKLLIYVVEVETKLFTWVDCEFWTKLSIVQQFACSNYPLIQRDVLVFYRIVSSKSLPTSYFALT